MGKKEAYIKLYADDYDTDVWEQYCVSAGCPLTSTVITVRFNYKDVSYDEGETEYA